MPSTRSAFFALVAANAVSAIGSGLTTFTLAVVAFERTSDATAVGLIAAAGMLPMILVRLVGGVIADRFDRRLTMLVGDGASAVALVALALLLATTTTGLVPLAIALALAVSSAFAGLTEPAMRASVNDLVPPADFDRAAGLLQLGGALQWLIAPGLAGMLLLVLPPTALVLIDAGTLGTTIAAAVLMRLALGRTRRPSHEGTGLADFLVGLRTVFRTDLVHLVALMTLATTAVGAVQALLPPLVLSFGDRATLGLLTSVSASGMLVGALIVSAVGLQWGRRWGMRSTVAISAAALGAGLVVIALRPDPWLIGAGGFLFFLACAFLSSCGEVMLRRRTPNAELGRVWGVVGFVTQLGAVAAFVAVGPIADSLLVPALLEGGVLAGTIGPIIGVGDGRGFAALLLAIGLATLVGGLLLSRSAPIARLAAQDTAPLPPSTPTRLEVTS